MTPIYFPFTFVRPAAAEWLAAAFETIGLLVASSAFKDHCLAPGLDAGPWQVHLPVAGDDGAVQRLEAELRHWAEWHDGTDLTALLAARDDGSPVFAVPEISHLRHRIQAHTRGERDAADVDPLLAARVFLSFAHRLDQDHTSMQDALASQAAMEQDMMARLHGISTAPEGPLTTAAGAPDAGAFLCERRLAAWGRLALTAGLRAAVLVTDSGAVIGALREVFPTLGPVFEWPLADPDVTPAAHRARFAGAIEMALDGKLPVVGAADTDGQRVQVLALSTAFDDFCRCLAAGRQATASMAGSVGQGRLLIVGPAD